MHDNWKIYGNLFIWDNSSPKTGGVSYIIGSNQEVSGNDISNTTIYNNTFADLRTSGGWGKIDLTYGSGNYVYNNVFYGLNSHYFRGSPTIDYNYYSKMYMLYYYVQQPHDTPVYDGGNGYYSTITSDPFVNSAAGDFRLSAALTGYTGLTLSSPYNYDMLGNARGADGTWDRGTYEYTGSTPPSYCSDSFCNGNETCSSCPSDCGVCSCTPNWQCTVWSACTNSVQTRTCIDANSCGTTSGKPAESQSCTAAGVFAIGDRVQVTSDPSLRVRSAPGLSDATILGTQPYGALGTVIGGPVSLDSYIWWQIDYDVLPDGWSIEPWLVKTGSDTTPPAAPTGVVVK